MVQESAPSGANIPMYKSMDDVDVALKKLDGLNALIEQATERSKAAKADVDAQTAKIVEPLQEEAEAIRADIKAYIIRRQPSIRRRFGRTIELKNGLIKFRIIPRSVEEPKDVKSAIAFLERRRGGKKYISYKPTLNKRALLGASQDLLRSLRPHGIWVGKHENITIQTTSQEKPTIINSRRFPRAPHRKKA